MKILFITTDENRNLNVPGRNQGDLLENIILLGLRKLIGENCVDYPRKKILYGDWSSISKSQLHGFGFSVYHEPMQDIPDTCRDLQDQKFDVILYGTSPQLNTPRMPDLESKCDLVFYVDSNDLIGIAPENKYINYKGYRFIGNQYSPSFKRELIVEEDGQYPISVGILESSILPINIDMKSQLHQKSYPREALFEPKEVNRSHYCFTEEDEYYADMAKSWFGLSCMRGGFDALRHYEIIAAGALLLYRDYHVKPPFCPPISLPTISYSSLDELHTIMNSLVIDNKPTQAYMDLLLEQREWLKNNATEKAIGKYVLQVLNKELERKRNGQ
jgi:hypothetical protein